MHIHEPVAELVPVYAIWSLNETFKESLVLLSLAV